MAYGHCIARLTQAAGRALSDDEVHAIFERIHRAALDIKAGRAAGAKPSGMGQQFDNVVAAAAKEAAQQLMHEAAVKQRQAQLQVTRLSARIADVDSMSAAGVPHLDAVEKTIARDYSGRVNVESLEQRVTGHRAYFGRRLMDTWNALGNDWLGFFQSREKLTNLVRELRGDDTGDALAKRGAKAFHDVAEEARQTFNEAGGDVGKLDDWGMPQHHSQEKVAAAGRDAWVDATLPLLDRGRYVDDAGMPWPEARMREFLGKAWDTIATNGHANTVPGQKGAGKAANRHAESRQIHFKDADSVISYWDRFGERTAAEILLGHIETMARDIAFVEHFGPNPNVTYQTLRDLALQKATVAEPTKTPQLEGRARVLDGLYDYAAGRTTPTYRQWLSATADGIAHLNTAGKLGGAVLASLFGDKPMMEAVSHLNNLPAIQRWRTELSLLNPANAADRRLIQQQGLMIDNVRSGLQRFYEGLGKSGFTGRLANAVMRVTGMQAINDIRKGSFGLSLMAGIGTEIKAGKTFADLSDSDVRTLRQYGITADDWAIWQKAPLQDVGGLEALTPEAISQISDAEMLAAVPQRVATVRSAFDTQIAELNNRNASDAQRFAARQQKFGDLQDRINRAVKQFAQNRFDAAGKLIGDLEARLDDALGTLADVRESTTEGASAIRSRFDEATRDAAAIGRLRQRMRELASDATEAITARADDARDRIEAYRGELEQFVRDVGGAGPKQAARAADWIAQRRERFDDLQDQINRAVKDYAARREGFTGERVSELQARVDQLLGEVQTDRDSAVAVMRSAVNAVDEAAAAGRDFGTLRERIKRAARDADNAVNAKAGDAAARIEAVRDGLNEYAAAQANRAKRRDAVIDRLTRERDEALSGLPSTLRREAIVKLLGAVNTESEFAIVTPGWKERAAFYADLQRGTVKGEIARSVLQFKSFPFAVFHRMADAVANVDGAAGKGVMTAFLVASTTLAGAMLMQSREMLSGKDPRDMTGDKALKFWGAAFLQGGALGIYGDFLYGVNETRYGSGPVEALAGPTIGPLLELGIVQPLTAAKKSMEGKETHFLAQELQDIKGFVPGGNVWYAKAALDHLVFQQVLEAASPGYLANIRARTQKEYGQDWWWAPGEFSPDRAPDFSRAGGG